VGLLGRGRQAACCRHHAAVNGPRVTAPSNVANSHGGGGRAVDSHVGRLRRKLGALGERIVTVWGVGYRFIDRAD
jgi:DNA-binding response OmpR family regulator